MNVVSVGADALLVEVGTTDEATALFAAVRSSSLRMTDVVPAARTVLLDGCDVAAARSFLDAVELTPNPADDGPLVELPTVYDGPDLLDVARLWDMTSDEVVATHSGTTFTVAFCGFSPGFAYCTGLPRTVPRLATPRPRVQAGSVGLAGEFTGVYPSASPGGWRLVGRTDTTMFDVVREPPALLAPGSRVRFVRA